MNNSNNLELKNIHLIAQGKPKTDYMEAFLSPKPELLKIDSRGCIKIKEYVILWPYGYKIIKSNDKLTIIDNNNNFVANIGDRIQLSGGECSGCTPEEITEITGSKTDNGCFGTFWIVGSEINK